MNRIRLEDTPFHYDEFQCGGRHRNLRYFPDGCPYCYGTTLILPWVFRPLIKVRIEFGVPIAIMSGHRCPDYNRDIHALIAYNRLYNDCSDFEKGCIRDDHDSSRHLIDALDLRPLTNDAALKERVYARLTEIYSPYGYCYVNKAHGFGHFDTRYLTKSRIGR